MIQSAYVACASESDESFTVQMQRMSPIITNASCGSTAISGGFVRMPPGRTSLAHQHLNTEIIIAVITGFAATIVWNDGEPESIIHGPGSLLYVPPGQPHCAVNLSLSDRLTAFEFRTDPEFNEDVTLCPNLEQQVADIVPRLRHEHAMAASSGIADSERFRELAVLASSLNAGF